MKFYGGQSQRFDSVVKAVASSKTSIWKIINPDSNILAAIKAASPATQIVVRIYTGAPTIDDKVQHPDPEQYGYDYATKVYAAVQDPTHMDYLETENEPNDHYNNLTEFISRMNAFLVGFSRRAKELGFKPLGPNFSTGYPEVYVPNSNYVLWPNAWQGLVDGLRALKAAGGALGLHEYDSPDLFRLWSDAQQRGYLIGRCKAVYASLPTDLQDLPLILTEFGIDWLTQGTQGGFWHNRGDDAPAFMVQQMRDVYTRVYSTVPQLKGVCFFIWGTTDTPHFAEYDITNTDTSIQTFTDFFGVDLGPVIPPPPPSTGWYPKAIKKPLTQHNYFDGHLPRTAVCLHIAAGPLSAIYPTFNGSAQVSAHFGIGKDGTVEQYVSIDNSAWAQGPIKNPSWTGLLKDNNGNYLNPNNYVISIEHEGFPEDIPTPAMNSARNNLLVWLAQQCNFSKYTFGGNLIGHYMIDSVDRPNCPGPNFNFNDITKWANDTLSPPAPPEVINMTQPFVMPDAIKGFATAVPYVPVKDEYFYRLSPKANVHNGVSALIRATVLDETGAPEIGVQVVNVRPDGKGEIQITDGLGTVQFNLGPGSAFTQPGTGPHTVYMALNASVPVDPPFYVSQDAILGDKIGSLGDFQGTHTEQYLQFKKIKAEASVVATSLDEAVRYTTYGAVGKGAKYNPAAALQAQARKRSLGAVLTDELYVTWQGIQYVLQGFTAKILVTKVGSYADADFVEVLW